MGMAAAGENVSARFGAGSKLRGATNLPLIAPSILSADFAAMGADCGHILGQGGADLLHLDVMDGNFVPNLTMGPDLCRCLRKALPNAYLDVHLMVTDPAKFVDSFAKAGANHFAFHIEAVPDPKAAAELASRIRSHGMEVGIAINPPTPIERIVPYLELADLVLVMSVNPGFSGQSFIESTLEKTAFVRARIGKDQRLQMDGGVSTANAGRVRAAGCDVLVAASAIFGQPSDRRAGVVRELRGEPTGGSFYGA